MNSDERGLRAPDTGMDAAIDRLLSAYRERFGDPAEAVLARAPGRVNLIGDHTDYNDGFVLPMTLDRAIYLALRPRPDRRIRMYSVDFDEEATLDLDGPDEVGSGWQRYVAGVARLLRERGLIDGGFEGTVHGTVPVASGLSSSAALEMATAVTLQELFGFDLSGPETARLGQEVEHRFVGVQCGIMDQFVSRLGRADHALFLDCRTLEYDHVTMQGIHPVPLIIDSRASRALAGSKYNERRGECELGVAHFRQFDPEIRALRDVSIELFEAERDGLSEVVERRCRHVIEENQRVLDAVAALRAGDAERFGELMDQSHESLRDLYEVSSPELDLIVETARACDGVLGARMTGAGFGGCAVALVEPEAIPAVSERVRERYQDAFGKEPALFPVESPAEAGPLER